MRPFKIGQVVKTVSLQDATPLWGIAISREGYLVFSNGSYRLPQNTQANLDLVEVVAVPADDDVLMGYQSDIISSLKAEQKARDAAQKKRERAEVLLKEACTLEEDAQKRRGDAVLSLRNISSELKKREAEERFRNSLEEYRKSCNGEEIFDMSFHNGTLNVPKAIAVIEKTARPVFYRYGFAYRGAEKCPVTKEQAIGYIRKDSTTDVAADERQIVVNQYSSNDLW